MESQLAMDPRGSTILAFDACGIGDSVNSVGAVVAATDRGTRKTTLSFCKSDSTGRISSSVALAIPEGVRVERSRFALATASREYRVCVGARLANANCMRIYLWVSQDGGETFGPPIPQPQFDIPLLSPSSWGNLAISYWDDIGEQRNKPIICAAKADGVLSIGPWFNKELRLNAGFEPTTQFSDGSMYFAFRDDATNDCVAGAYFGNSHAFQFRWPSVKLWEAVESFQLITSESCIVWLALQTRTQTGSRLRITPMGLSAKTVWKQVPLRPAPVAPVGK
jgi:hypothetical protein